MDNEALDVDCLDNSQLYAQIVRHARLATGCGVVALTTWSPATGAVRTQASSGYGDGLGRMAVQAIRRSLPSFAPNRAVVSAHANAVLEVVYVEGQAVTAPFEMVVAGAIPDEAIAVLSRLACLRYSTVEPLKVKGSVVGALTFHDGEVPSEPKFAAFEAFAQQVALTLENAMLLSDLHSQIEEIREARRLVTASNESVRREIAERLHGPVQTQLVVADFMLRKASSLLDESPAEAKEAIAHARSLLEELREKEIRDVSHLLHPCVIGLGLAPAIRSLVDRFRPMVRVALDLHPDLDGVGAITAVEVDDATRLAAYRVVEEALANVNKHADATEVKVSLMVGEDDHLIVSVSDNGRGFNEGAQPGLGLRVVAMKVEEVRGTWAIGRSDSGGLTLSAALPLRSGSLVAAGGRLEFSARRSA